MQRADDPAIRARGDAVAAVSDDAWEQARADAAAAGATQTDDTAMMLLARRALMPLAADAAAAAGAAARLAERHRDDAPSFALTAAGWMSALDDARTSLRDVRNRVLAVQMSPADDPAATAHLARQLNLAQPLVPWHAIRLRPAVLAAALAGLAHVLGAVARDVGRLVPEPPAAADAVRACTDRVPALAAKVFSAAEDERETLGELLLVTGSAAAWATDLLENLVVDVAREDGDEAAREHVDRALATHRA